MSSVTLRPSGVTGPQEARWPAACLVAHRFLVEAPANVCTPSHLAAAAAHLAALDPGHFTLKVRIRLITYSLGLGASSWTVCGMRLGC
jgi:leucyl aminopeptidase